MAKPRLLDLFCCAGGAAAGYTRAGFEVVGVDIVEQLNYPYSFIKGDALDYVGAMADRFDVIHASPPCQAYSIASRERGRAYPDLLAPTRQALAATGKPYVIENVPGAPMANYWITLCGEMFGKRFIRHRNFESNVMILQPGHQPHRSEVKDGYYLTLAGHGGDSRDCTVATWREVMEMPWASKREITQAVPPCYTEFIGRQLIQLFESVAA